MEEKKYYSIGQVSNTCKIPIKTLRYYDEIQLLVPKVRKETSKYRYYSKEQLIIAIMIRQLRSLGFNLKDIKEMIQDNNVDSYMSSIHVRLKEIDDEMAKLEKKRRENEHLLLRFAEGKGYASEQMTMDEYKIENIPEINVIASRSVIKSYRNEEISLERWISISEEALVHNLEIAGPVYVTFFTEIFGQFFAKDCDIEFAVQVMEDQTVNRDIHKFGGFTAATAVHRGNYADIFKTYIALKRWIDDNNYEICGNATEQFLISPLDTTNIEEHITKIIVPVKMNPSKK